MPTGQFVAVLESWFGARRMVRFSRSRTNDANTRPGLGSRPSHFERSEIRKKMGQLITMPTRNTEVNTGSSQNANSPAKVVSIETAFGKKQTVESEAEAAEASAAASGSEEEIDFSVWKSAPKERTPAYFPTYSAVSRAMQSALRGWVREWFHANPDVLTRPHTAYPILVYQCTHPFAGKRTNIFTYDIQETEVLDRAFSSAARRLGKELKALDTKRYSWFTREYYFAYRSEEVVKYVKKNRKAIYKMLNVDTVLMDSILNFAVTDVPGMGLEAALKLLRRAFEVQLRRFSTELDMTGRVDELLKVATDALLTKLAQENAQEEPADMPLAA